MERTAWTDERLDERMTAVDHTFDRLHDDLGGIRDELRGLRGDFSRLQGRLVQIGSGLVGGLVTAMIALIIALL
jgi:DNA anti-recombination protein RmuC